MVQIHQSNCMSMTSIKRDLNCWQMTSEGKGDYFRGGNLSQITLYDLDKKYIPANQMRRFIEPHQFNIIKNWHRMMSKKYKWYIRFVENDGYYTNTHPVYIEPDKPMTFYDCQWTNDEWDTRPHHYHYIPDRPLTKVYRSKRSDGWAQGYNAEEVGYKREGVWLKKFYHEYAMSVWLMYEDSYWKTNYKGVITRYDGEGFTQGVFSHQKKAKKPDEDFIEPMVKRLAHKSNRNFYDDDIKWICENTHIRMTDYL